MTKEMTARDIMQDDVRSVPPTMPVSELERLLIGEGLSGVPVLKDKKLVGIICRSDIVRRLSQDQAAADIGWDFQVDYWDLENYVATHRDESYGSLREAQHAKDGLQNLTVSDLMTKEVITVDSTSPLHDVADLMSNRRVHRVLVVDGSELRGVITTMDFTRLFARGYASAPND